jgi:hypothetical protein
VKSKFFSNFKTDSYFTFRVDVFPGKMKRLQNCETVNSNFWKFWKVNFEYRKGQIENQIRKVEILIRTSWRLKSVKLNIESDKFIIESGKLNIESGKSNIEYYKLNIESNKIEYRIRTSTWLSWKCWVQKCNIAFSVRYASTMDR